MRRTIAGMALLALAACGSAKDESAAPEAAAAATATTGAAATLAAKTAPASFGQCKACHAVEPGKHGIGPSLHGVYGTKSGELAGFAFSPAMKQAGLTWDDATLDTFLTAPMKAVPGTKMSFAGLGDPAKRKEIIAYIKSLK